MLSTRLKLLAISLCLIGLFGCSSAFVDDAATSDFSEQLYIDARRSFAIKHPMDWQLYKSPVSSPEYRADVVRWVIKDVQNKSRGTGEMLIRSLPADPSLDLPDLLSQFLASAPELQSGQVENFELPSGAALKLLGEDETKGRLTIAIKGKLRDFIISLDYPASRFDELLPTFNDIISSFVEIIPANDVSK